MSWRRVHPDRTPEELRQILGSISDQSGHELYEPKNPDAEYDETRLKNYEKVFLENDDGTEAESTEPMSLVEITDALRRETGDWPRCVNGLLFVPAGDDSRVRFLETPSRLFTWIGEKFGNPADYQESAGFHSKEELFNYLVEHSKPYESVEYAPHFPKWKGSYYFHD